MATFSLPVTIFFWLGEWPCTSALGFSTRSRSAVRRITWPSSNATSRTCPLSIAVISVGQAIAAPSLEDADARGGLCARCAGGERIRHPSRDLKQSVGLRAVGHARDDRAPLIGIGADGDIERHFAEKRNAELFGFFPRPSVRKDVGPAAAMRTDEVAHILDNTEKRHFDLIEHRNAAPGVD